MSLELFFIMLLVFAICACSIIYSKIHGFFKVLLVTGFMLTSLFSYNILDHYVGEPRKIIKLENDVIVYGSVVDSLKDRIYLLYTITGDQLPAKYVYFKYNKEMHGSLVKGTSKHKGKPFRMTGKEKGKEGEEGEGKKGENQSEGKKKGGSLSIESATFNVHENLPPPDLPKKDYE